MSERFEQMAASRLGPDVPQHQRGLIWCWFHRMRGFDRQGETNQRDFLRSQIESKVDWLRQAAPYPRDNELLA